MWKEQDLETLNNAELIRLDWQKKDTGDTEVCVCQKNKATVIKDNWLLELENWRTGFY